jgi:preprotein translocase subunit SecE
LIIMGFFSLFFLAVDLGIGKFIQWIFGLWKITIS